MSNFYITTDLDDNKFVCTIFNKNTNVKIYQTQKHSVQQDAVNEANMYLRTNALSKQIISADAPQPNRRCCGR